MHYQRMVQPVSAELCSLLMDSRAEIEEVRDFPILVYMYYRSLRIQLRAYPMFHG